MLFEAKYREPIASGAVDLTFRRWKRSQAVVGHRYRTAAGRLEVDAVDVVAPEDITEDEARRAGQSSAAAVVAALRGPAELPVFRIRFHAVTDADERDLLAAAARCRRPTWPRSTVASTDSTGPVRGVRGPGPRWR